MKIPYLGILSGILTLSFSQYSRTQIVGGNAYMIGDHVEIGIDPNGMEGTDDLTGTNSRGGTCATSYFGFVANSEDDGWGNYNGDYFTPGVPENGFGLDIDGLEVGNNATGCGTELYQITGGFMTFLETTDSIFVDWSGTVSGIEIYIRYELQKDLVYFTTKVRLENTTASPINNVYYYRTMDPDNNQTIAWGYGTTNKIMSQSGFSNDSAIVRATQSNAWDAWVQFEAFGPNWRVYHGGFSNRDGSEMWSGLGFSVIEGSEITADAAIGIAYRITTLNSGSAAAEEFQFNVRFAEDAVEPPEPGIGFESNVANEYFEVYPNPTNGQFTIDVHGTYDYLISDSSGKIILIDQGEEKSYVDLSDLPAGIYFLKVRKNGKFKCRKLVVE